MRTLPVTIFIDSLDGLTANFVRWRTRDGFLAFCAYFCDKPVMEFPEPIRSLIAVAALRKVRRITEVDDPKPGVFIDAAPPDSTLANAPFYLLFADITPEIFSECIEGTRPQWMASKNVKILEPYKRVVENALHSSRGA